MKQIVQDLEKGTLRVVEVPAPVVRTGGVLVRTCASVVSVGTERTKVGFGRKGLVGKALERPEQVRQVVDTVRREGVAATYRKVRTRLSELSPLGYSCAGVVEAVGAGVTDLRAGDRVACAGAGFANHAERIWVPRNLVVPVPGGVALEEAAFVTVGAIALQGVRQADARLGEVVVVIGLGLLGQLTLQILRAAGVRAIGVDVDARRVELARERGFAALLRRDGVEAAVKQESAGAGADAVIITAGTSSRDPIRLAGALARDRARVVVVGAVPIDVPRSPYYEKELEVRLSRSYGPGRYDPEYEERGHDYPIGYVRWTENRNLGEFIRLLSTRAVDVRPLITHRAPLSDAERVYAELEARPGSVLGAVLEYPEAAAPEPRRIVLAPAVQARRGSVRIGVVGAGNFATATLLPILKSLDVTFGGVATASGLRARHAAERFGFAYVAGAAEELFADPELDAVVIATRHDQHAALAAAALRAGKAVFVEKPLALEEGALDDVLAAASGGPPLMVGFNRRFAPAARFVRDALEGASGTRLIQIRVNAGALPRESWVHDPAVGGGRLIGEACHFIDLAAHLAGAAPVEVSATGIEGDADASLQDNVVVTMRLADGSVATIVYTSKGEPRSGKERAEVFAGGVSALIDDFRAAEVWAPARRRWRGRQDKGHAAELAAFVAAVQGKTDVPIALEEIAASSRATLAAARSLASGAAERVERAG